MNHFVDTLHYRVNIRSSRSQMFFQTGVLKNFSNFTGKHLRWSLFLINLLTWRPSTILKRDFNVGVSCKHCQIFKNSFFIKHLWWLPLVYAPFHASNLPTKVWLRNKIYHCPFPFRDCLQISLLILTKFERID